MMRQPLSDNTNMVKEPSAKADGADKVGTFFGSPFKRSALTNFFYGGSGQNDNGTNKSTNGGDDRDGESDSSSGSSCDDSSHSSRGSCPTNDDSRDEQSFSESTCASCNEEAASLSDSNDYEGGESTHGNHVDGFSETDSLRSAILVDGGNPGVPDEVFPPNPKSPGDSTVYSFPESLFSSDRSAAEMSHRSAQTQALMRNLESFEIDLNEAMDEAAKLLTSTDEAGQPDSTTASGPQELQDTPTCNAQASSAADSHTAESSSFMTEEKAESSYAERKENILIHSPGEDNKENIPQGSSCQEERVAYLEAKLAEVMRIQDERIANLEAKLAEAHRENACLEVNAINMTEQLNAVNALNVQHRESLAHLEAKLEASETENTDLKDSLTKANQSCSKVTEQVHEASTISIETQQQESINCLEAKLNASEKEKAEGLKKNANLTEQLDAAISLNTSIKAKLNAAEQENASMKEQLGEGNTRKGDIACLKAKLNASEREKAHLKISLTEAKLENERLKKSEKLTEQLDAAMALTTSLKAKLGIAEQENANMKEQLGKGIARKEAIACLEAKLDVMTKDWSRQDSIIFSLGEKLEKISTEKEELKDQLLNVKSENKFHLWEIATLKRELAVSASNRESLQIALKESEELVLQLKKEKEEINQKLKELKEELSAAKAELARPPTVWERLSCA